MTVPIVPLLDSLILRGHPVTLRVDGGHLVVEDGLAGRRRRAVLSRICPEVRRILIFARSGYVSLEALGWLHDVGIPLMHLHPNGAPIFATAQAKSDDARLRRAQAAADTSPHGVTISRWLLGEKIQRQATIIRDYFKLADLAAVLDEARTSLDTAETLPRLRLIESAAAAVYWSAWTGLRPRFPLASTRKIPAHWLAMKNRRSPLTDSPRRAADPINCLLNYLYAIVAAEVEIALRAHGCDTGLGIIHADRPARANMVYDAMEPVRPRVEHFVLQLLRAHTFDRRDFLELTKGDCRVLPPLANHLAAATGDWRGEIEDTCLGLARRLEQAGALAQASRPRVHDSRADLKDWKNPPRVLKYLGTRMNAASAGKTGWYTEVPPMPKRCRRCGEFTPTIKRTYCDGCAPLRAADGSARAAQLIRDGKSTGNWSGLSVKSKQVMGRKVSGRFAEMRKWREKNPVRPDPDVFAREIFPKLSSISTAELRRATGLTKSYCQRVRRGMYVPHPMHWETIRKLVMA